MSIKNLVKIHHNEVTRPHLTPGASRKSHQESLLAEILTELRELRTQAATKSSLQPLQPTLDYAQAALLLNTGESTVQSYVRQGLLKRGRHYFKIKGHVSFPPDIVARIMEDQLAETIKTGSASKNQGAKSVIKIAPPQRLGRASTINENY